MKTDKPFLKSFAFAGIFYVLFLILILGMQLDNIGYRMGSVLFTCSTPAIIVGFMAKRSKKEWSKLKIGLSVFLGIILILFLQIVGRQ